jgi:putative ABC transport system substrate-binding protein
MLRRRFVIALGAAALAAPFALEAQSQRVWHIGFLGNSTPEAEANLTGPFRDGLRELGYIEGRNAVIEYRWANGNYKAFPRLVAELVARKVDVIVTAGTPAAQAVQHSAPNVPLVMVAVGDPVGTHLAGSLATPGGNSTGLTSISPDLEGKRLELLQEIVPKLAHIALLYNSANPFHVTSERNASGAAERLGIRLQNVDVRTAEDLPRAFEAIRQARPDAFIMLADRVFLHNRAVIADFAAKNRLPAMYPYRELVEAGGLMSFGPNYADMHRRAATYVDKILKGAKPGDLPIEMPTKFELIVNLEAARALDLKIPQAVLVRADQLIR